MRFLFSTILSIIFLTYPLFCKSLDNVTLYKWKTSYGVQWKKKGDIDVQDLYEGEVENGEPNGLGIIIYVDGSQYFENGKTVKKMEREHIITPMGFSMLENSRMVDLMEKVE